MKTKDILQLMAPMEEMIPDSLFLGWEVISIKIISFLTQEDYQDTHPSL